MKTGRLQMMQTTNSSQELSIISIHQARDLTHVQQRQVLKYYAKWKEPEEANQDNNQTNKNAKKKTPKTDNGYL